MKIFNNKKGIGLAEVPISIAIIIIIAMVGFNVRVTLRDKVIDQETRLTALGLASSQIEDLKETAKTHFNAGALGIGTGHASTLDASDIPANFTLTYDVGSGAWTEDGVPGDTDYKQITVTSTYPPDNVAISLIGYIVE